MNFTKLKRIKEKTELKERSGMDLTTEFAEFIDTISKDAPEVEYSYTVEELVKKITAETLSEIPEARLIQLTSAYHVLTQKVLSDVKVSDRLTKEYLYEQAKPIFCLQEEIGRIIDIVNPDPNECDDFIAGDICTIDSSHIDKETVVQVLQYINHIGDALYSFMQNQNLDAISQISWCYFINIIFTLGHCIEGIEKGLPS